MPYNDDSLNTAIQQMRYEDFVEQVKEHIELLDIVTGMVNEKIDTIHSKIEASNLNSLDGTGILSEPFYTDFTFYFSLAALLISLWTLAYRWIRDQKATIILSTIYLRPDGEYFDNEPNKNKNKWEHC